MSDRVCPTCGTVNPPDRDFCPCGEYLRWEPTGPVPTPPSPVPPREPAAPAAPESAVVRPSPPAPAPAAPAPAEPSPRPVADIVLRDPQSDDGAAAEPTVTTDAGGSVGLVGTVRNQGLIVDNFDLSIEGIPREWWSAAPATLYLVPYGSHGDYEQYVQIQLHPPRSPVAEARAWPLRVTVRSRALGREVAWAPATLVVLPYAELAMTVEPERRSGRRSAQFRVDVRNAANAPAEIGLTANDQEHACPTTVTPARVTVPAGASAPAQLRVHAPRPIIFGRPVDHQLEVRELPEGHVPVRRVTFRQQPWFPWWVPPLVLALLALLAGYLLTRGQPEVPNVTGTTLAKARQELRDGGYVPGDVGSHPAAGTEQPGEVVRQRPEGGEEADKGSVVSLTVATAEEVRRVPDLDELTVAKATARLDDRAFLLGAVTPAEARDDWIVTSQTPRAGQRRRLQTPVDITASAPRSQADGGTDDGGTPGTGPGPGRGGGGGLRPATLAFMEPGTKDRRQIYLLPKTGEARPLTGADKMFDTPSWTPEGRIVAIQEIEAGRQVVEIDPTSQGEPQPLSDAGAYHRPIVSPDGDRLAVINADNGFGSGDLCVKDYGADGSVECAPPPDGYQVGRPAWSPDGEEIVVLGALEGVDNYTAMFIYRPNEGAPASWQADGPLHETGRLGAAAWIDDTRLVALEAQKSTTPPSVVTLVRTAGGIDGGDPAGDVTGCSLAVTKGIVAVATAECGRSVGRITAFELDGGEPEDLVAAGSSPAWAPPDG